MSTHGSMNEMTIQQLTADEIDAVSGGALFLAVPAGVAAGAGAAIGLAGGLVVGAAIGFAISKALK